MEVEIVCDGGVEAGLYSGRGGWLTLGSGPDADVCLVGPRIDPTHAKVERTGQGVVVEPLHRVGALPLLVNGHPVTGKALVSDGAALTVGPHQLRVSIRRRRPPRARAGDWMLESGYFRAADLMGSAPPLVHALHAIGSLIGRAQDAAQLGQGWLELMMLMTHAKVGALAWRDGAGLGPWTHEPRGQPPPRLDVETAERVLTTGVTSTRPCATGSQLYFPLRAPGEATPSGLMCLQCGGGATWTDQDVEVAVLLGRLLALAADRLEVHATLRRKAEELERTRADLTGVLDALPEAVALIRAGAVEAVNSLARSHLAPLLQDSAQDSGHTRLRGLLHGQIAVALSGSRSPWRDIRLGAQVLEVSAAPLPGKGSGVVVVMRDITTQRAQSAELAQLLATAPDAIVASDAMGAIRTWNGAAERMFGYRADEVVGAPLSVLLPELAAPQGDEPAREPLGTIELSGRRRDGTAFPLELSRAVATGSSSTLAVLRDVTERKASERSLRDSEERFQQLAASVREVFFVFDAEHVFYVSPRYEELWGHPGAELVEHPRRWITTLDEGAQAKIAALLPRALEGEEVELEGGLKHPDGTPRWMRLRLFPMRDAAGRRASRCAGVAEDVTARRRAEEALRASEEQLRQSSKMEAIGRLAGGVAHDFNNLLTVILGYAEILRRDVPESRVRLLDGVISAGEKAAGLTRQLLAFSRRQVLQPTVLELGRVVDAMEPILRRLIPESVELIVRALESSGRVRVDRTQLDQVILNLAANAKDAMPDGGTLSITVADVVSAADAPSCPGVPRGPYVRLTVADTGRGMDAETLQHLFEPFYTTKACGTGLGLATVHGIITQSGGHISVTSQPGRGARFDVLFPRVDAFTAEATLPTRKAAVRGSETLLVVEDEADVRALTCMVLEERGYKVHAAASPEQALRMAPEAIDLLVTDMIMPGMNGAELHRRLAAVRPGLKVLFMSGYIEDEQLRQGVLRTGAPFLRKPFTPSLLAHEVRMVLDGAWSSSREASPGAGVRR